MPNPVYVNTVIPVDVTQDTPPRPVESSNSFPQKGAKHAIAYTLYAVGQAFRQPTNIPNDIRTSRQPKKPFTNQGQLGQHPAPQSAAIIRVIPPSYSERATGA